MEKFGKSLEPFGFTYYGHLVKSVADIWYIFLLVLVNFAEKHLAALAHTCAITYVVLVGHDRFVFFLRRMSKRALTSIKSMPV
jgi:hypothetical protein